MFIKVKETSLTRCDHGLVTEGVYTSLDRNIIITTVGMKSITIKWHIL